MPTAPLQSVPGTTVPSGAEVSPAGSQGPAGSPGVAGPAGAGVNAFSNSTAPFTVPAVGSTVVVTLVNALWCVVGQMLWIDQAAGGVGQPGIMQVTAISGNNITLLNPTLGVPIPIASTTAAGLVNQLSGVATQYVGGDNACHPFAVSANLGNLLTLGTDTLPLLVQPFGRYYGTDTTNSLNYVVTVASDFTLSAGVVVFVLPSVTNIGGSPTLNVNGSGAKPIVNRAGIGSFNAIEFAVSNKMFGVVYDGVSWRLITSVSRVNSQPSGTYTFECAGFDSVSIYIGLNSATATNITLAHLAPGVPVFLQIGNGYSAAVTVTVTATNVAGAACTAYCSFPTSLTGAAASPLNSFALASGATFYFSGSIAGANSQLVFSP